MGEKMHNVVIIGAGPAGLTAAIYTGRAMLKPLVICGAGEERGGQIVLTNDLENFPGFPDGLNGYELHQLLERQAMRFGAEMLYEDVLSVDLTGKVKTINTTKSKFEALSVIIATGSKPRHLGVKGEAELARNGVSYCATCDGFFFMDKNVAVIGGGDSALDEGLFLTRFAKKVTIIHRRDTFRANAILQERAKHHEKVDFIMDTVVEEIVGDKSVKLIRLRNVKTNELTDFPVEGVFVFIGHQPNIKLFEGQINLNSDSTIITDRRMKTNCAGVFACGDVQDSIYRQAITAAGSGCQAAIEAEKYNAEIQGHAYPGK
jgi:thioredoxin reductase (NADPH)